MKYVQKYLLLSVLCAFGVQNLSGEVAAVETKNAGTRAGFVDIQRILPTSDDPNVLSKGAKEWADLMMGLASSLKSGDDELQEMNETYAKSRAELQKLHKEFEALQKSGLSSPKAMQEKQVVLQNKIEDYSRLENTMQTKMQKRQETINNEIKRAQAILAPKLQRVIDDLIIEFDLDLILRKEMVIASREKSHEKMDLTESVLAVLNEKYIDEVKSRKETAAPKKEAAPKKSAIAAA